MKRDWPLVVRRARAGDRDAVLAFATNTWDGWDYIPSAWPFWLEATDGVMLVGCRPDDDVPVAVTRVAMVSPTEAWWEGIRVDPAVRGMDVAADLQVAELHWSAAQGANVIRYATGASNEGSHRLGARHGIELLLEYRNYWWSKELGDPHEPSGFDAKVRDDASVLRMQVLDALDKLILEIGIDEIRLWATVERDPTFKAAQQLYEPRSWALGELTAERFEEHAHFREVITVDKRATAILSKEQLPSEDLSLRLAFLVGDVDGIVDLVGRIRDAADGRTVRFRLPVDAPYANEAHDRLLAAGYQSGKSTLHILGRTIDADHPIPEVDPDRLVLAEQPAAVVEPLEFR